MARTLLNAILAMLLLAWGAPAALAAPAGGQAASQLSQRLEQWPQWRLPAPLLQPGTRDLPFPPWFAGNWLLSSEELPVAAKTGQAAAAGSAASLSPTAEKLEYPVRFRRDGRGRVVGDRAFNARAIGRALVGDGLQSVRNDPANPNRQLARLAADRLLESTVVGRLSGSDASGAFLADELSLQVLHAAAAPRVSQVEVLSRWQWHPGKEDGRGWIEAEQWQASYPSPAEGLTAAARSVSHRRLRLEPRPPGSDPAS
jgi:hypothetical protein